MKNKKKFYIFLLSVVAVPCIILFLISIFDSYKVYRMDKIIEKENENFEKIVKNSNYKELYKKVKLENEENASEEQIKKFIDFIKHNDFTSDVQESIDSSRYSGKSDIEIVNEKTLSLGTVILNKDKTFNYIILSDEEYSQIQSEIDGDDEDTESEVDTGPTSECERLHGEGSDGYVECKRKAENYMKCREKSGHQSCRGLLE